MTDPYLTLPLDGLRLIEASAGTGKTFTLATLFTRLVVEKKLRMGQILAVTFTEAATQELRARIRERLELAARLLASETQPDESQETLLTRAILQRAMEERGERAVQVQARLRLAAEETDLAAIFTIHGFCAQVLREYALDCGQSLEAQEILAQTGALYAEIAADLWRRTAVVGGDVDALTGLWKTPQDLADDLAKLTSDIPLQPEMPVSELPDPQPQCDAAATTLLDAINQYQDKARQLIEDAFNAKILHGGKRGKCTNALTQLQTFPHGDCDALENLASTTLAGYCNKGKSPPASPLFDAIQLWCEMDARKQQWRNQRKIILLHKMRHAARLELDAIKQQRKLHTYDDLIIHLANALQGINGESLAARLRAQYQFALVDEFQDTDARQWDIFRRIFAASGYPAALFLIGDPKQAIYGFRGGDVETYLKARDEAEPAPPLQRNFRSRPALLRAIERLYANAGNAAFAGAEIRFEAVLPGGRCQDEDYMQDGTPAPALTICTLDTPDAKALPAEAAREAVTRACVADIHRVLSASREQRVQIEARRVHPGDIAVLVRTHKEATRMQKALSALGIPAVAAGRRSLFASDEANDIRSLLTSLIHPADESRLRAALAGVLIGLDAAQIAALDGDSDARQQWQQRAFAWREHWQRAGVFALIAGICATEAQRLLALGDGERRLTNYLQLAEMLQEASAHAIGLPALLDWLQQRMLHADHNDDAQQLRLESDARCVQIVTLHKSKGLEYPLVYLPFIGIDTASGNSSRWLEIYQQQQRILTWAIDPASDGWKTARAAARQQERAEAARLLYVGLTRARHALWLAAGSALPGFAQSPPGPMLQEIPSLAGDDIAWVHDDTASDLTLPRLAPEREHAPPPPRSARRRIASDWWVYSFTQWARTGSGQDVSALADEGAADDEDAAAPSALAASGENTDAAARFSGARFGNALHAALETTRFEDWNGWTPDAPAPASQTAFLRAALAQEGWHGEEQDTGLAVLTPLVGHSLTCVLPEGGSLSQRPAHLRRAEMEFHFHLAPTSIPELLHLLHAHGIATTRSGFGLRQRLQGLMTGKIDLVYVGEDRRWYVLDYKSSQLPGYGDAVLLDAMQHGQYDLQALLYTLALHRWLRFRLGDGYDYARDVGGIRYLFCRGLVTPGEGLFAHRFAPELVQALDALFAGQGRGAPR